MKILGSDFDGTLNYGGMSADKILAIQQWREKGHKFGIVSGRGKDFRAILQQKVPELCVDFLAVCSGGYITDQNGDVIYEARCDTVPASELVKDLFSWGSEYARINGAEDVRVVAKAEELSKYGREACLLENMPPIDYFNQISIALPTVEGASDVVEKVRNKHETWLTPLQNGRCIDIVPRGVDKAQGMYRVMEFFGGSYEDVITVGDNINDLDMIREFRSYAMRNGVKEVKDLAHAVVSDVTDILIGEM